MQAASRQALSAARERMARHLDGVQRAEAERLSEELFAALRLLDRERVLRRHLADVTTPAAGRAGLVQSLLEDKVSGPTLRTLTELVGSRWSAPRDLVDAVESLARQAALAVAGKDEAIEDVEDGLFRIGRLLDREPRLRALADDPSAPADKRVELIRSLIARKTHEITERLLVRAVEVPRGRSLVRSAEELAELAAANRDRYVAHVASPVALTGQQEERLAAVLSRVYGRRISLQIELAPECLGGLTVRVGDEVIDGSVASRLAAARQRVPR